MKHVLVTGGGGYIGSTLVPVLLENGYDVRVVDRLFFGEHNLRAHDHLEIIQEDSRCLDSHHFHDVNAVIDLVGISNDPSGDLFQKATWEINHDSRIRTATLAKQAGVSRYILPSSCSLYGFHPPDVVLDETSEPNPLSTYAKANLKTESGVLELVDHNFCVTVLRMATAFGASPRMRFDLSMNGMTFGAWNDSKIPLMRDGSQWRPMIHVKDIARAMLFMLHADPALIGGEIFNTGSNDRNYSVAHLGEMIANALPKNVDIEWYGTPDQRSYRVSFDKIEKLGFSPIYDIEAGAKEIYDGLENGRITKSPQSITLNWYKELMLWQRKIQKVCMYGGILDLPDPLLTASQNKSHSRHRARLLTEL